MDLLKITINLIFTKKKKFSIKDFFIFCGVIYFAINKPMTYLESRKK